jgi:5-methylcytosine-specific restriction endonuclease McrA
MNTAILDQRNVLVLNKIWQPIEVISAFKAISKLYSGKADAVSKDYGIYDFYSWVENWEDLRDIDEEDVLATCRYTFPIPEIIRVKEYKGYNTDCIVKFNRRNIRLRDKDCCQYCGKHCTDDLTLDHIIPKSRGGENSWTNLVVACMKCNNKKADKTPKEAGMRLISQPVKPNRKQISKKFGGRKMPKSWADFVGELYWETELK